MIEVVRGYHERTLKFVSAEELKPAAYERQEIPRVDVLSHLKWMCEQILSGRVRGKRADRWLGYIQGELRADGKFTIAQLREQTRSAGVEYCCGFASCGPDVALILKAKPPWQQGKLNGVGGKVEPGETPAQAMIREWEEETGSCVSAWGHFVTLHTKGHLVHFFRAQLNSRVTITHSEDEPVDWYEANCLPSNVIQNLRWLIPMSRGTELFLEIEED